jgi:putative nucleotidyltransferase with HDIG domain
MYLAIPIVEMVFCFALLIILMISGKKHIARKPFSLFLVIMTSWGFFIYMMRSAPDMAGALFWEKLVFLSILSGALFFYRFTITLTSTRPRKRVMYPVYFFYLVVLSLIPTGLIVQDMQMMWYGKAPVIGLLFPLYVLCAYVPIVLSAIMLLKLGRHSRFFDDRIRAQYILIGIGAMFVGATTDYLPALGVNMYPLGIIGNILFCVTATIAMLKYNLLEMKVVLRKGTTYSLTSILIFGVFGSFIYLLSHLFQDFMSPLSLTITIITVFIAASIFQPVLTRLTHTVDRWFFGKRYDHIQTLKSVSQEMKGELDLEQLASSLVTASTNGLQSQGVYLLLPSPVTGNYATYAYCGHKGKGRLFFYSSSLLVKAMKQQTGVMDTSDIDIIPALASLSDSDRQALEKNGIELLVPLKGESNLAGMLLLSNKISRQPYTNEERRLLKEVATNVAPYIESANQYANIKQRHSELQQALDGVIHAVSLVVETRDPYTAGHQRRVAELARAIAREMGLPEWQVTGVYIAGLLHDVGKVAVPAEILSKPGKITQHEFSIISNHCRVGYEILERIDFPWPVTKAILQHHERMDGSGYPDHLTGEEIVIEARILGVADVVEAMSSHRPYRPALGLDKALQEISQASGVLYDSKVVHACLRLLRRNEPEFDRLMAAAEEPQELELEAVEG